jgi:hypothetical protein
MEDISDYIYYLLRRYKTYLFISSTSKSSSLWLSLNPFHMNFEAIPLVIMFIDWTEAMIHSAFTTIIHNIMPNITLFAYDALSRSPAIKLNPRFCKSGKKWSVYGTQFLVQVWWFNTWWFLFSYNPWIGRSLVGGLITFLIIVFQLHLILSSRTCQR